MGASSSLNFRDLDEELAPMGRSYKDRSTQTM
jgi:hypothetical protein